MKSLLLIAATSALVAGCSFAARNAEMYRDDTKAVLETKNNDIRACYDGVLKTKPGAQGKVTIKFNVETEAGKFTNVAVDKANTTAPAEVADCVTRAARSEARDPTDDFMTGNTRINGVGPLVLHLMDVRMANATKQHFYLDFIRLCLLALKLHRLQAAV